MVLVIHLISSLSPMLIQSQARQSAGSHLVVACCSWLSLLISSAPGCVGDQFPSRISTPPRSGDQPCGELSGKAAQALLTNLSHQSHSLLQPAPNICHLSTPGTADFFQHSCEVHGDLPDFCELWSTFSAPRMSPNPPRHPHLPVLFFTPLLSSRCSRNVCTALHQRAPAPLEFGKRGRGWSPSPHP